MSLPTNVIHFFLFFNNAKLPLLADWFAYPGENGLAITQVIYDYTEMIVTGEATDMAALQEEMMEEIEDLM